jgi:beta-glucosidase
VVTPRSRRPSLRRLVPVAVAAVVTSVLAAGGPARADTQGQPAGGPAFRNPALSVDARVTDLLHRLTLAEKISLLHQYEPAIPRLGIAAFKTGTEALHGVAWATDIHDNGAVVTANGTVFPQAVGLASTWDPALIRSVGSAVGDEARGFHARNPDVWSLQLWAPVVNLLRDPRWGRNEEGYSEDPFLTGAVSTAYGSGLTGGDPAHLKAAPVLKHYLANNNEVHRDTTSSQLRPRVLNEYDRAAFQPAISAGAATGVMASYNLVNGRPNTVSPDFNQTVRSWSQWPLLNVTDAGAPNNLPATGSEAYLGSQAEADAAILTAGIDSFTVDNTNGGPTTAAVNAALARGLLTESDVDTAVSHILSIRVRLGEFDPDGGKYGSVGAGQINSAAHQKLARQTAAESMVLLKNSGALPLSAARARTVAVVGPLANTLYTDWYSGSLPYQVTPLDGIRQRLGTGASVPTSEGVDRIALKDVTTGRYVTGGAGAAGADLALGASTVDPAAQFDVFDWGQGIVTLRSAANGRYVGRFNSGPTMRNDQAQPNGWFVQQQFALEAQPDGTVALRYAGYEKAFDWAGPAKYLTVDAKGTLQLTAPTAAAAAHFDRSTTVSGVDSAVAAVRGADTAVVVVGSMPFINGREDHDRTTMALAEGQEKLVRAVRAANPRTVVVLENSYPTTVDWEQRNVPALLWTTHAGAETGHALADVLFGDADPSGRLPQTWYRGETALPDILDYDIIKAGRTYQYFRGSPLFAFGHGLSYTSFRYGDLRLSQRVAGKSDTVRVSVDVTNTGRRAGTEVVQLYTHQRRSRDAEPVRKLAGFTRVQLAPGQTKRVSVPLKVADLAHWDVTRDRWVVETSPTDVLLGSSATDIRARGTLSVRGETIPARNLARTTDAVDFDDLSAVTLVDRSKVDGDAVASTSGWLKFAGADLGRRASTLTVRTARAAAGTATVQLRLDSPRGRVVGTATVPSTGSVYSYASSTAALSRVSGHHDVYLVFGGDLRLADFSIR